MISFRYHTLVAFFAGVALVVVAGVAFQAWRVEAAPGDTDTTFVSMTPCRLIDTRPPPERVGPNGGFGVADTKTIQARGSNGNCTIPADAVALSLNVTAVGASSPTFLTIWSDGVLPTASSLNPSPGEPPTPNAVTTDLSATGRFNVYNKAGTVDVIIDVNGYHTKASLKDLASQLAAAESRVTALEDINADGRLDGLESLQPIVVHAEGNQVQSVDATGTAVRTLAFDAPVDGTLIVNSSNSAAESMEGDAVRCSITLGNLALDSSHIQEWQSGGLGDGGVGQMSGTRGFDIPGGGPPYTVYLFCAHNGSSGSTNVYDSSLTATFFPTP